MMKRLLLLLILSLFCVSNVLAISVATGSGVKVIGTLEEIVIEEGKPYESIETINVPNPNDFAVKVKLTPDEVMAKIGYIIDDEFVLQAKEVKNAQFQIKIESAGTYNARIWTSFEEIDGSTNKASGSMASKIRVIAKGYNNTEWYNSVTNPAEPDNSTISENGTTEDSENGASVSFGGDSGNRDEEKTSSNENNANPLIGVAIIAVIIVIGLIVFFIISKLLR